MTAAEKPMVHVVDEGPQDAPTMVLIHGTTGCLHWWDPVIPALGERHRIVRLDLPGHGRSSPARTYDVAAQAGRVSAVLDELGITDGVMVGHSSGGYIVTALAEQRPDLVRALVLIATGPELQAAASQGVLGRLVTTTVIGRALWALRTDAAIRRALVPAFSRPVAVPDALVDAAKSISHRTFIGTSRALDTYITERSVPDRLAPLGKRVLVIFGADDLRWHSSSASSYRPVPNCRIEVIPGVGHTPMFEAPDTTIDLLTSFAASRC